MGELGPESENLLLGLVELVIQHLHLWEGVGLHI